MFAASSSGHIYGESSDSVGERPAYEIQLRKKKRMWNQIRAAIEKWS